MAFFGAVVLVVVIPHFYIFGFR